MTNLQPVAIVDKNGRATTVHRRSDRKASAGTSPSLPKVSPQNAIQGTPLEPITPATKSQTRKLMEEFKTGEEYWPVDYEQITKKLSKRDITLVKRLLENPAVNNTMVLACISSGAKDETICNEEITNALLVMEHMYANGDGNILDSSGPYNLYNALLSVDQITTKPYLDNVRPITTQQQLEASSAFAAFVLLAEANYVNDGSILRRASKRFSYKWTREFMTTQNKHLKQLILDRPEQQHQITDYIRSRGMHPKNKKPVDTLRTYLDAGAEVTAVSSGWL